MQRRLQVPLALITLTALATASHHAAAPPAPSLGNPTSQRGTDGATRTVTVRWLPAAAAATVREISQSEAQLEEANRVSRQLSRRAGLVNDQPPLRHRPIVLPSAGDHLPVRQSYQHYQSQYTPETIEEVRYSQAGAEETPGGQHQDYGQERPTGGDVSPAPAGRRPSQVRDRLEQLRAPLVTGGYANTKLQGYASATRDFWAGERRRPAPAEPQPWQRESTPPAPGFGGEYDGGERIMVVGPFEEPPPGAPYIPHPEPTADADVVRLLEQRADADVVALVDTDGDSGTEAPEATPEPEPQSAPEPEPEAQAEPKPESEAMPEPEPEPEPEAKSEAKSEPGRKQDQRQDQDQDQDQEQEQEPSGGAKTQFVYATNADSPLLTQTFLRRPPPLEEEQEEETEQGQEQKQAQQERIQEAATQYLEPATEYEDQERYDEYQDPAMYHEQDPVVYDDQAQNPALFQDQEQDPALYQGQEQDWDQGWRQEQPPAPGPIREHEWGTGQEQEREWSQERAVAARPPTTAEPYDVVTAGHVFDASRDVMTVEVVHSSSFAAPTRDDLNSPRRQPVMT
ncbi:retinitis pigmentosa 1-like 1 protein [Pollicipes pollicipes]|uniref:retinitis pigmentosa 1-like 1 protein n=1 Tax=Pollicipes pollicipes TaxID=41117 RepID=UPI001884E098|nr:retinitis pigmentosa 1-like 1 protein [Pollicipes pollicipes]